MLSQDTPCIHVKLASESVYWFDVQSKCDGLASQDIEFLRLECKYFADSLQLQGDLGTKRLERIFRYIEDKANLIKGWKSNSLVPEHPPFKNFLDAANKDPQLRELLCTGFSSLRSSRTGAIWGGCKFKEMVAFIKWRFGPAYSLLIICIFGTTGRYEHTKMTTYQLAKVVQWVGQDHKSNSKHLYWSSWEMYWKMSIETSNDVHTCTQLRILPQLRADKLTPQDPQGTIDRLQNTPPWYAVVMNEETLPSLDVSNMIRSDDATSTHMQLVILMSLMGGSIRDDILRRGVLLQNRWDHNGHETTASRTDITQFMELFAIDGILDQEIQKCIKDGLIASFMNGDGAKCYTSTVVLDPRSLPANSKTTRLLIAVFAFAAYVYPRDVHLEQSYSIVGRLLMPMMNRLWDLLDRGDIQDLPDVVRGGFIEASLSACRLTNAGRAKYVISTVRRLRVSFVSPFLVVMLTWQMSVYLRKEGKHEESDASLDEIFRKSSQIPSTDRDIRLHCAYGRLFFSKAENAIMRNDFDSARGYIDCWAPRNLAPTPMEINLSRMFSTIFGRISRYTGDFDVARHCFERCLIQKDPSYHHTQFHLADVYCELGLAVQSRNFLLCDVERLRGTQAQRSRVFRRLALALAEAYINLRELTLARETLGEVVKAHESTKEHDMTDQLDHVRTLISLARVDWYEAMYAEADAKIKQATVLVESYSTFQPRGFEFAFINLFHSVVKRGLAREVLLELKQSRGYFMAGIGTYFFDEISAQAWAGT